MKKILAAGVAWALPVLALAQNVDTTNINAAIRALITTVNLVIPLMLAVAVVVFIYGVIRYVLAADDINRSKAVNRIVWSVVSIAAILAVWGLARLLINVFGIDPRSIDPSYYPVVDPDFTGNP
jgi:hypothetical protein